MRIYARGPGDPADGLGRSASIDSGSSPASSLPTISANSGPISSPISCPMRHINLPTDFGSFSSTPPRLAGSASEFMRESSERAIRTLDIIRARDLLLHCEHAGLARSYSLYDMRTFVLCPHAWHLYS